MIPFQVEDLKRLICDYKRWAYQLFPNLAFGTFHYRLHSRMTHVRISEDFLQRVEKMGSKAIVKTKLEAMRIKERDSYIVRERTKFYREAELMFEDEQPITSIMFANGAELQGESTHQKGHGVAMLMEPVLEREVGFEDQPSATSIDVAGSSTTPEHSGPEGASRGTEVVLQADLYCAD
jgi:hypothetical protein